MKSKTSLWGYYSGEPFMENPHIAILNPTGRGRSGKSNARFRKVKTMAKRRNTRSKAYMAWVRSHRKKKNTRARRNPWPMAGMVVNSRRKVSRRKSYRRNPSLTAGLVSFPPLKQILFAGVGFAGTPVVEGFVNQYVPASITGNTLGKYAVKIGSAILLAFAVKKVVGPEEGKMVAIGGGAYVLTSAVAEFAPGVIPGLSAYVQPTMLSSYVEGSAPTYGMLGNGNSAVVPFGSPAVGGSGARFDRYR